LWGDPVAIRKCLQRNVTYGRCGAAKPCQGAPVKVKCAPARGAGTDGHRSSRFVIFFAFYPDKQSCGGLQKPEFGRIVNSSAVFSTRHRRLFMNLTISGHHLEVTPALRNYVTTKLDRITRHFDQVVDVKVLLTVEKQKEKERRQRAECNIHVKGSDMFAECTHADLYAAVDELVDKLDRQVVRHKDRLQNHHHDAPKRLM
jgi:putative sigma-54 modulation protein